MDSQEFSRRVRVLAPVGWSGRCDQRSRSCVVPTAVGGIGGPTIRMGERPRGGAQRRRATTSPSAFMARSRRADWSRETCAKVSRTSSGRATRDSLWRSWTPSTRRTPRRLPGRQPLPTPRPAPGWGCRPDISSAPEPTLRMPHTSSAMPTSASTGTPSTLTSHRSDCSPKSPGSPRALGHLWVRRRCRPDAHLREDEHVTELIRIKEPE